MWDFETDPEYQEKLDWADRFIREEVEPLEYVVSHPLDLADPVRQRLIPPLQDVVRAQGLWACHLGPELGGPGYGQVKLALLNEILGRSGSGSTVGPVVFGCQAPDTGNAEILAHYGTEEHKRDVPPASARRQDLLLLLDDRASGWFRPQGLPHRPPSSMVTSG